MSQPVFTVKEYATLAKKHPATVEKWARLGRIRARKDAGGKEWRIFEDPLQFNTRKP